jgi:hypothetical protein
VRDQLILAQAELFANVKNWMGCHEEFLTSCTAAPLPPTVDAV